MAAINGSTKCGRGFGWGNGCGLLRSDQVSHRKPISFFFPEILHEMCFWCSSSEEEEEEGGRDGRREEWGGV